jgi:dihydroneopterin aldolase
LNQIFFRDIRLDAQIGIYKRERAISQPIAIDLDLQLASDRVFTSGKISDTIDYAVVVERVRLELAARRFGLVEELAEFLAQLLLDEFGARSVRVSVAKLGVLKNVARTGTIIERSRA